MRAALLDIAKYDDRIAQNRTKAVPNFRFDAQLGVLLQRLDFQFDRAVFGAFSGLGPVPAQNTTISTPIRVTALLFAQIAEPISQQYKIRLGTRQLQLGKQIAQVQVRAKRQMLAQNVKQVYYAMLHHAAAGAGALFDHGVGSEGGEMGTATLIAEYENVAAGVFLLLGMNALLQRIPAWSTDEVNGKELESTAATSIMSLTFMQEI